VARYRFSEFVLSPRRRVLIRDGREQPLIPRYFDLLVFLVEHRHEAVHRRDIFDRVWSDVVVSDSALSQAIRTIRRTLGDNSREPRFIRTVSRHGYRFVFDGVVEEEDADVGRGFSPVDGAADNLADPSADAAPAPEPPLPADLFEPLLQRLTRESATSADEEDRREAAELLHALGTAEALARLGTRPGHAAARALLRDTRWDAPDAGDVPVLATASPTAVAWHLTMLRLRRAKRIAAARWAGAALGSGAAGAIGGAIGGLMLMAAPTSAASTAVVPVLAVIGAACGAAGGAGVGAGLSVAEATFRSRRAIALVAGGALGGGLVGLAAEWLSRWSLAALVGVLLDVGGGLEGVAIGAAAGLGYAASTPFAEGGLAAPRGWRRVTTAAIVGLACAAATLALALSGRALVGGTVHLIAEASQGSQVVLTPLGRLVGEPDFGPVTAAVLGLGEGLLFGAGLAFGLTRRPK
jgi:DNA-binding winged helix-turn-helix (wHTH) protein